MRALLETNYYALVVAEDRNNLKLEHRAPPVRTTTCTSGDYATHCFTTVDDTCTQTHTHTHTHTREQDPERDRKHTQHTHTKHTQRHTKTHTHTHTHTREQDPDKTRHTHTHTHTNKKHGERTTARTDENMQRCTTWEAHFLCCATIFRTPAFLGRTAAAQQM